MHIIRSLPRSLKFRVGQKGFRYFPVRGCPRRARKGDTIFFAHQGKIIGRSRLLDVRPVDPADNMSYLQQGPPSNPDVYYYLCVAPIEKIVNGPEYIGRVGIRYVDKIADVSLRKHLNRLVLK